MGVVYYERTASVMVDTVEGESVIVSRVVATRERPVLFSGGNGAVGLDVSGLGPHGRFGESRPDEDRARAKSRLVRSRVR